MTTTANAMQAVEAARANGGSLFTRVAGCAEAVRCGWLELLTSRGRVSVGSRGTELSSFEKRNGWIDREWRLTDRAPK